MLVSRHSQIRSNERKKIAVMSCVPKMIFVNFTVLKILRPFEKLEFLLVCFGEENFNPVWNTMLLPEIY